ncbi:exo-beta-N-acetylmuramidase NamZ family protein [Reichenbachiella ulvae]|uniref:DUF1343 domain-containing protein n=1 Tax=Reichenbachiella ulvae TaxID=2980104 RepID=A0ABT3CRI0_9BACT|nr:DUF1343 domain-containing protein [Reichenbachiella ulvae]MCV9386161.1 DUF1343 domain-containing protein [Reichenbachiella ulvae]
MEKPFSDGKDIQTGLPIISLYGKNKKPNKEQLSELDLVIYDIQDVGARFYTYISSMHYMMEACAENQVEMMILDRPNPHASYVDGPILELEHQSFVGMHPIPVVYALTAGELAQMIVGEKWINQADQLKLEIIEMDNWNHQTQYELPISPSPNLPNDQSIKLYPSLCLFEGTKVSVGRGTDSPFQVIGLAETPDAGSYTFTPVSMPGYSKYPKHENTVCYGKDLREVQVSRELNLEYLINMYKASPDEFFNSFFTKLAGTESLEVQIKQGQSAKQIKDSWQSDLIEYQKLREKYLLYDD